MILLRRLFTMTNAIKKKQSIEVVIIGAGFSGLGAAKDLHKNGVTDFLVLEGRDRIGGRAHTSYELGKDIPVDLGSAWIQGKTKNPIMNIVTEEKIPHANVDVSDSVGIASHSFFDGTTQVSDSEVEKLKKMHLDPFLTHMEEQQENWLRLGVSDMSLRQFADTYLLEKNKQMINHDDSNNKGRQFVEAALHATIATEYAADLEDLSMLSWDDDDELNGGDCYMAVGHPNAGYSAIVEALANPFKSHIQLSSVVKSIEYCGNNDEIKISYYSCKEEETKHVFAKHVIVTLPLGVLKANVVKFSPPLPIEKQMTIEKLGNGITNKCCLYWEDTDDFHIFWPTHKDWLVRLQVPPNSASTSDRTYKSCEDAWLEFYNAYKFNGKKPVLIAWSAGNSASSIEHLTDEQVTRDVVASLRLMFENVPEPTKSIVTRWETDEFSRGAYSYLAVGCTQQTRADLGKSIDGKLFFAGEATETIYSSTTQGAFITGQRAALEVMDIMTANRKL